MDQFEQEQLTKRFRFVHLAEKSSEQADLIRTIGNVALFLIREQQTVPAILLLEYLYSNFPTAFFSVSNLITVYISRLSMLLQAIQNAHWKVGETLEIQLHNQPLIDQRLAECEELLSFLIEKQFIKPDNGS